MALAPWLVMWFVVGIVSTVAVLACLIGLLRHLLVLGRTVKQLQEEMRPIADEVSRERQRRESARVGDRRASPPRLCHEDPGVESRGAEAPLDTC